MVFFCCFGFCVSLSLCVAGWKKEKEGDKGRRQGLSLQAGSYYEQWHQKNQLAIFLEQLFTRFSKVRGQAVQDELDLLRVVKHLK